MNQEIIRCKFNHAINATPFSEKGRGHLNQLGAFDLTKNGIANLRKKFYTEIYVQPSVSAQLDVNTEEYNAEEKLVFGKKTEDYSIRQRHKELFESNILNGNEAIFMLTGSPGSGKTTYLNWLFDNIINNSQNKELTMIDIENTQEVRNVIYFCDFVYDLSQKFHCLSGRFVSAVIFQLNQLLRKQAFEGEDEYKYRMLELIEKYKNIFCDKDKNIPPDAVEISSFFNILETFVCSSDKYSEFASQIKQFITSIEGLESKKEIETYFMLFIRVLLCQPKNDINNSNKSYIVAIDNIERLLDGGTDEPIVVQEKDLEACIRAIKNAIENTDSILNAKGYFLRNSLIVIFSVRDTTIKLFTSIQDIDNGNEPLDISDWFDAQNVYDNKFAAYLTPEEQSVIKSDVIYNGFNTILGDKRAESGLYTVISNMYNHNKRRIPEVLREIVLTPKNIEVVQEYLKWWEYSFEKGVHEKGYIRHLCRKAILRLFYNRFAWKGLYRRFGVGTIDGNLDYASYARKVLTFLREKNPKNKRNDSENYVSLNELVKGVLMPTNAMGYSGINSHEFIHLSKMLHLMTDVEMVPHYWAPLVEIIIVGKEEFNNDVLLTALHESESCYEHKIKITDAGRTYALLNSDFEYFASRYTENRSPLIFSGNLKKENGIYPCLEIIKNTRSATISCMKKLIEFDRQTFQQSAGSISICEQMKYRNLLMFDIPHPVRIARQHIGYLEHYRWFVDSESGLDDPNRKEVCEGITNEIAEYEKEIRDLLQKDKNYTMKYFPSIQHMDYSTFESWVGNILDRK